MTNSQKLQTADHRSDVDDTYLALRIAMVALVLLLFGSIMYELFRPDGCLQSSISAFYYTPVRPVFVGTLCAIGACLIIYRGNNGFENGALDFSGFLAFLVAVVPKKKDITCGGTNVPIDADIQSAVANNALIVLLVGVLGLCLGRIVTGLKTKPQPSVAWPILSVVALASGLAFYIISPTGFKENGHNISAIAMFVGIIVVAGSNAFNPVKPGFRPRYQAVALSMLVTLIAAVAVEAFTKFNATVFYLEAALIAEFAVFWSIQTAELGLAADRTEAVAEQSR